MNRILVYGLASNILGGIETFLLNMNKFMSKDTIFDYVIEGTSTIHQDAINEKGGKCFFISPKKKMFSNIKNWKKLLDEQKNNYKVIYFNMYSFAWIFPICIALKKGYKVIVHAHNAGLHNCGLLQKIMHKINRQYQKHLKIIRFTNSELSRRFFFGSKEAKLIYNAIDTKRFAYDEVKRNNIRKKYNIKEDEHLYGFSGRFSYEKNPLFLIGVFNEIRKIDAKSRFIMCGDGVLREKIEQKANELHLNVIFAGSVKNIEDCYSAMDCFILPSRFEGLGLVLIEAEASGLRCVASKDVIPELANINKMVTFLPLKNVSEWARSCYNIVFEKHDRHLMKDVVSSTSFNIEVAANELEQNLLSLL